MARASEANTIYFVKYNERLACGLAEDFYLSGVPVTNCRMQMLMKYLQSITAGLVLVCTASAQTNMALIIRGPLYSGTIRGPKSNNAIAMKGLVITLGADKKAFVCFDADLLRFSMGWTGEFLEF